MTDTIAVNLVIESFENWQQPWTFYSSVVGHPKCIEDNRGALGVQSPARNWSRQTMFQSLE